MSTNGEAGVNPKLAQFRMCLHKDLIKNKYNLKLILERMNNINYKIVATPYLQLHYAKWIGFTALHFAVSNMDLEAFDILLRHGAELTIKNSTGLTALHQLVENRRCYSADAYVLDHNFVHSVVSAHVKYNNYENPVNPDGLSHFHIACTVNHVDVVKGFLQNGEFIDQVVNTNTSACSGFTPLHFAIKYKAYEVTEVLLLHGANIHIKNAQDMTPLYMALERKIELTSEIFDLDETSIDKLDKILKIFIEKEDKNEMMNVDWGLSHLHVACTLNDSKIAEIYVQNVLNINHTVSIDSPRWPGYTALHFAALCNIETVKLLMKKGADISIKDAKGATPLDTCTGRYETEDIYAVITMNPNWKNIMLSDGKTKLTDLVFAMRDPNEFKTFLEKLAGDIHVPNSPLWPGYTPMHLAVIVSKDGLTTGNEDGESPSEEILKYLHEKNPAMLNSKDVHGYTPLHLAFRLEKSIMYQKLCTILESLVELVDLVDEDGLSYVHIAAAASQPFLLSRLLSTSANVNAVYKGQPLLSLLMSKVYSGATPLHFAVSIRDTEAVKVLMEHGADVYAKDVNGITPVHLLLENYTFNISLLSPNLRDSVISGIGLSHLHVACRYNYTEIVQRLLDDGADINGVITYKPIANAGPSKLPYLEKYNDYSPLLMAYKSDFYEGGNYRTVEVLLQRGADVWVMDTEGRAWVYGIIELNTSPYFDLFIKILIKRVDVQTRLKADTGMTDLHIACFTCDSTEIEKLLNEGANVNAQVRSDSPILKGYTPLHIVIHVNEKYNEVVNRVIKILLKAGADVTLQNGNSETAVHAAWGLFHEKSVVKEQTRHIRVNMLLEAQRNFHMNPANAAGISHFHIACHICSVGVVQKLLSHGDVDVDRPVDFFYAYVPGTSALHLAAGSDPVLCGVSRPLRTIDLLLKNGANVHVEDAHRNTPLHVCAHFNSLDLFERIASNEADVNARNVYGNTPLYYYLNSENTSVEGVKTLLRFGCNLNVFNTVTGEGLMSVAMCKIPHADLQSFLNVIIINFTQEMEADNLGRTVIHNIISTDSSKISADQYVTLIEQISEANCDVDRQDNSGRTALHMAVEFYNYKGVFGLLMTGADINVTDANGKTAFNRDFDICPQCEPPDDSLSWFDDGDDGVKKTCKHLMTLEVLAFHVKYLQLCGLHVDKQNEELARKAFKRLYNENAQSEEFLGELEMIKSIRIEPHALTLYDFLSENGAVADYPTMSEMKREDINEFFSASEVGPIREKFPDVAAILQLQYRKARARPELVELAKNSMELLIGFRLPEICSQIIMVLLTNSELKNLIDSMI